MGAKRLLIIGLGDSQTFTPRRMQLVGETLYIEASRLLVSHPYFAPTIRDGGLSRFSAGEIADQVVSGFLRVAAISKLVQDGYPGGITELTYLAGAQNVNDTRKGIEKAIAEGAR